MECCNSKLQPCLVIETAKFTPCISIIQNKVEANTQHSLCALFLPPLVLHQEQCNYVCSRNRSWHTAQEASNQTRETLLLIAYYRPMLNRMLKSSLTPYWTAPLQSVSCCLAFCTFYRHMHVSSLQVKFIKQYIKYVIIQSRCFMCNSEDLNYTELFVTCFFHMYFYYIHIHFNTD